MNKILLVIVILVLAVLCIGDILLWQKINQVNLALQNSLENLQNNSSNKNNEIISAFFKCAGQKTIQAIFFEDKAGLTLSDNRNMLLMRAMSGSGARYTNTDESFIFWNKGDMAFIQEKGTETFKDCLVSEK